MRKNSKEATREAILAAARTVLASDGPEALKVSRVAALAGINRGTAYQHFQTREDLIKATVEWVSDHLSSTIYGDLEFNEDGSLVELNPGSIYEVISLMVNFAVENPTLGRVWLFELLASENPGEDKFFRLFKKTTQQLAESQYSQGDIDVEALSVIVLSGYFIWPEWVRAHADTDSARAGMAARMSREMLRLFMHGVLKTEEFPQFEDILKQ
ncbi:TetR/AcrR family transcriptional regulator [Aestuariicella hydrocarbonica]|uniref:TetR/AcrR family transcriptional regulator n=1 Tax=Pseudomaricurvus hydrocarbonicus TaxID=1470433 RepID=A0A9E5JUS0_9GAMM|nr:TetR/AcrR family transcriptional regulator [Aestuariicella hydrocarbonica]NHO65968.1 TetR/AcrR family transcriptional regulator [Aestuariicella hydrocarbonica]